MKGLNRIVPTTQAGNLKILLLIAASSIVFGMLVYSQRITERLLEKEREVVDLYAHSYEYIARDNSSGADYSFLFDEIIQTIDFPIILTDADNVPITSRNVEMDTTGLDQPGRIAFLKSVMAEMDQKNKPIRVALNDTLVLSYIHYGESNLIIRLRWLPYIEISLAAIFIFIAYIGFSYIKRHEQSNIWVGMARETAHQLGTPLSSIMGWLEILKEDAGDHPKLQETINEMDTDVRRLSKVADRFSKIGSRPDLKEEDLTEMIQDVVAYIYRRIPKSGRQVEIGIDTPGQFRAMINRELFEWVLENLMKNALDAMDGPVARITFSLTQSGGKTNIDVADTGKGIEPKLHKEVFRPGFSTKKRGWGLGLSLSKRIIEDYHRGKLYVKQSIPGEGTTFRIRLFR
ncbi:MAG: HAMP domain-containing histidine kinase [Ignavibacteria bacterium]|nr:HAMP domain-containing histidine kinase [Ignavibacteria bacterium]